MNQTIAEKGAGTQAPQYREQGASVAFSVLILFMERLGYYGARAILVLYMLKVLSFEPQMAYGVYALFGGAALLAPMLCGWVCDVFLDKRLSMLTGNVLSMLGMVLMATGNEVLLLIGLGIWAAGSGALRPAQLTYFGEMISGYGAGRLDGAYTLLYGVINLGALLAPLSIGVFAESNGYDVGFLVVAGVFFMNAVLAVVGLATGMMEKEHDTDPVTDKAIQGPKGIQWLGLLVVGAVMIMMIFWMLAGLDPTLVKLMEVVRPIAMVLIFLALVGLGFALMPRKAIGTLIGLIGMLVVMFFWVAFEVAGGDMFRISQQMVEELNLKVSTSQMFNPLFAIFFSLLIGGISILLVTRRLALISAAKIVIGLIVTIGGYLLLLSAVGSSGILVPVMAGTALIALGEILVSPVIMSLVFRYAARRARTTMMGAYVGGTSSIAFLIASWLPQSEYVYGETMESAQGVVVGILVLGFAAAVATGLLVLMLFHEKNQEN